MRRFLVIVVASLVPVGMWTAGCRQERQAAFPNSPEMASLAKSGAGRTAEAENPTTPPEIPPAPIDRSVMHLADSSVLARVQAVSDQADQLAGPTPDEGLFTLPDLSRDMASAPAGAPAASASATPATASALPARSGPLPSGREFWSKPVAARTDRPVQAPADISAMSPAAAPDYIATPPSHYQAPAAPSIPGLPGAPTGSRLLPPEDVPGVFLFDENPTTSFHSPPASRHSGLGLPGGDALSAPPSSSNLAATRQQHGRMRSIDADGKATAQVSQRGPLRLDLSGLIPTSARRSAPVESAAVAPRSEPASAMPLYRDRPEQTASAVVPGPVGDLPGSAPIITLSTSPVHEPLPEPVPLSALATMPSFMPLPDTMPTAPVPSVSEWSPVPETPVSAAPASSAAFRSGPVQWVASPSASAASASSSLPSIESSVTSSRRHSGTMSLPVPLNPSVPAAKPMEAPLPFEELPDSPAAATARTRTTGSDDISQALAPLPDLSGGKATAAAATPVRTASPARQPEKPVAASKALSAADPLAAPPSRPAALASMPLPSKAAKKEAPAARQSAAPSAGSGTAKLVRSATGSAAVATAETASKRAGRIPEVTLPQPVSEAMPTPELTAAKTALLDFSPEALDEVSLPGSARNSEFFKTDFWDTKPAAPGSPVDSQPATKNLSLPIPELPMPAAQNRLKKDLSAAANPVKASVSAATGSMTALPAVEPREPIWVETLPASRQQEKEIVPEYRYEVTPKRIPAPAAKTRIDTVEAREERKESVPVAPKKVKLTPIGKQNSGS